ncbi:hypothetical protein MRX96_021104 [Rhipicephalus microplus]
MSVRAPPGPNLEYDHNRVLTWLQDWMSVSTNEEENLGPPPMNHYATISSLGHRSVRSAPRGYVDPDYVLLNVVDATSSERLPERSPPASEVAASVAGVTTERKPPTSFRHFRTAVHPAVVRTAWDRANSSSIATNLHPSRSISKTHSSLQRRSPHHYHRNNALLLRCVYLWHVYLC